MRGRNLYGSGLAFTLLKLIFSKGGQFPTANVTNRTIATKFHQRRDSRGRIKLPKLTSMWVPMAPAVDIADSPVLFYAVSKPELRYKASASLNRPSKTGQ